VRFYIDLCSTKPIDKASIEAGIRELKLQGWNFFNMRLREDGRRLTYSGVSGSNFMLVSRNYFGMFLIFGLDHPLI